MNIIYRIKTVALCFLIHGNINAQPAVSKTACYKVTEPDAARFTGRYKKDALNYVEVYIQEGQLLFRPLLWTSGLPVRRLSGDSFYVYEHPKLKAVFTSRKNNVSGVELLGFKNEKGSYTKITGPLTATEHIIQGKVKEYTGALLKETGNDSMALVSFGETLLKRFITKKKIAAAYLEELSVHYPQYPDLFATLGETYIALGLRNKAILQFRKALLLDSSNETAITDLHAMGLYKKTFDKKPWSLPFSLDSLFLPPTRQEMQAVQQEWKRRMLAPADVLIVTQQPVRIGNINATAFIVSHSVKGSRHYGAVIIPENKAGKKLAAIIELKGVSPSYFPVEIPGGLYTPSFLCGDAENFIYIVPSFRGEKLIINGTEYVSEGDRTDSWDGATDDAIALLNVAVQKFPQIDTARIACFGKSRGGSVALLLGIRDKRIRKVLNWAGPTDWFRFMDLQGWKQQDLVTTGLAIHATPFETGGQFIERILAKAIAGKEGLAEARMRMLRSSPYYFSGSLPAVQMHYGAEDPIVPPINGAQMQKKMDANHSPESHTFFFHKGAGHDLDILIASKESREFLLSEFK